MSAQKGVIILEDEKIVDLLYVHDESGLEETKNKYESLLSSLAIGIVRNQDDSSECVNDTYLKIWNVIPPNKPQFYKAFICKIVRQISIDKYRYNHRKARNSDNVVMLSDLDYEISDNSSIEDQVSERQLINKINDFIGNLDIESQVLFVRKYFLFEETKSLSERFDINESNINVKLFRIKTKLRNYLEKEGYVIEKESN